MSAPAADLKTWADGQAKFFTYGIRPAPILHTPAEEGMEYEDVFFQAQDGVPISAWYIPAKFSNKVIICNHPMTFCRAGFPGHLPGFDSFGGFEVNLIPDYKHLHDAGYNVLAYDLRNHGRSGRNWSTGAVTFGNYECHDVVGSIHYIRSRSDTKNMDIGLFSRCMGANSTIFAIDKYPEVFKDIKCMLALQPVSIRTFIDIGGKGAGFDPEEAKKAVSAALMAEMGYELKDIEPQPHCHAVRFPTKVVQVKRDFLVDAPKDTQEIFDLLGSKDKELFWIEDTDRRFDGYAWFGKNPKELVDFFKKHL